MKIEQIRALIDGAPEFFAPPDALDASVDHMIQDSTARALKAMRTLAPLMVEVAEASERVANMFSTMPWCRLNSIDSETTCIPTASWKDFNFGPMHDLFESLKALEAAR